MAGPLPKITAEDVLAVFEDADPCEPFNATEIAEHLHYDCHPTTARNYLQDLVALGEISTKKVGPSRVYWQPSHP